MKLTDMVVDGITVVSLKGDLDLYNAPTVKEHILRCIENKRYKVIVNLKDLKYIDSQGIGSLINSLSNVKKYNGDLLISEMDHSSIRKIFAMTKLDSFFCIYKSTDDAIKAFKGEDHPLAGDDNLDHDRERPYN